MKLKQLVGSLLLLLLVLAIASCEDKNEKEIILEKNLPLHTQQFLKDVFPDNKVVTIYTEDHSETFSVVLDKEVYLFFDEEGNWYNIKADDGIPQSASKLLDEKVLTALTQQEPQAKIVELTYQQKTHYTEIVLSNKKEYAQCYGFEQVHLSPRIDLNEKDKLPKELVAFLTRNTIAGGTSSYACKITESMGTIYQIYLADAIILSFDEDGRWMKAEKRYNHSVITAALLKILTNEIAEEVLIDIQTSSKGDIISNMQTIICYKDGVYGVSSDNETLIYSPEKGILLPATKEADKLVNDYFGKPSMLNEPQIYISNPYIPYSSHHTYQCEDGFVQLLIDFKGQWKQLLLSQVINGLSRNQALPQSFIEGAMPTPVGNYLAQHYKEAGVVIAVYNHDKYSLQLDNRKVLVFDQEGNFLEEVQ